MKLVKIILNSEEIFKDKDAEGLRGFIGNIFKAQLSFHNHIASKKFNYSSPLIQYKIIDGKLAIIGIDRGADILIENIEKIKEIREIKLRNKIISVIPNLTMTFPEIKVTKTFQKYEFKSVWFALNQENYRKYRNGELLLSIQLRNNIIEFFKMCGIIIEQEIFVEGHFKEKNFFSKNIKMIGFLGEFKTNVILPDDISLGKRKSTGFGRIRSIEGIKKSL